MQRKARWSTRLPYVVSIDGDLGGAIEKTHPKNSARHVSRSNASAKMTTSSESSHFCCTGSNASRLPAAVTGKHVRMGGPRDAAATGQDAMLRLRSRTCARIGGRRFHVRPAVRKET